ncbi:TPA: hypothetical protein DEG21_01420 [Patescibacteria group bacterium]|nr:hypothetical protein [Candidatus Gracilibacteria bacterium]HBY74552.1 hypothetical protein [Candidatus Gracilibacteria bacterium]
MRKVDKIISPPFEFLIVLRKYKRELTKKISAEGKNTPFVYSKVLSIDSPSKIRNHKIIVRPKISSVVGKIIAPKNGFSRRFTRVLIFLATNQEKNSHRTTDTRIITTIQAIAPAYHAICPHSINSELCDKSLKILSKK